MNRKKQKTTQKSGSVLASTQHAAPPPTNAAEPSPADGVLERALRYVSIGDHERALDLLTAAIKSPRNQNARGVCLLRLGRTEAAIRVFRELLLNPGSTWMRPDLPTVYKTNYATALLVGGHPSGCLEIINEIRNEQHPSVQRLRRAIATWEASLSLWQRLNWRIGKIEPSGRPVQLDFPPGDFDEPATAT